MLADYQSIKKPSGTSSGGNTTSRLNRLPMQSFYRSALQMYQHQMYAQPVVTDRAVVQMKFPPQDELKLKKLYNFLTTNKIPPLDPDLFYIVYEQLTTEQTDTYFKTEGFSLINKAGREKGLKVTKQNPNTSPDYHHVEYGTLNYASLNSRFIVNTKNQEATALLCNNLLKLMQKDVNKENMKFKAFYGSKDANELLLKYDKIVVYYNNKIPLLEYLIERALNMGGVEYGENISAFYEPTENPAIGKGTDEDPNRSFSQIRADMVTEAYRNTIGKLQKIELDTFLSTIETIFRKYGYDPEKPWLPKRN